MIESNSSDFTMDDIYFKDAFTIENDKLNLEVNDITADSIISKNNKFSLDSEGNLVVKTITPTDGIANISGLGNLIYPVGSIYISTNSVDPSVLFGGMWELKKNRFLIGAGDNYSIGAIGGDTTFNTSSYSGLTGSTALTINQIPSHQHNIQGYNNSGSSVTWTDRAISYQANSKGYSSGIRTSYVGGSEGHNHTLEPHQHSVSVLPPYLAVNIWERIR